MRSMTPTLRPGGQLIHEGDARDASALYLEVYNTLHA